MRHHILLNRSRGIHKHEIHHLLHNHNLHNHHHHHHLGNFGGAAVKKNYDNEYERPKDNKVKHIKPLKFRL
jgi:hypothetical protein